MSLSGSKRRSSRAAARWVALGWTVAASSAGLGLVAQAPGTLWTLITFTLGLTLALIGMARLEQARGEDLARVRSRLQRARRRRRLNESILNSQSTNSQSTSATPSVSPTSVGDSNSASPRVLAASTASKEVDLLACWFDISTDGRIVAGSERFFDWCGFGSSYVLGKHQSALNAGSMQRPLISDLAFATASHRPWRGELQCVGPDGRMRWMTGTLGQKFENGSVSGFRWVGVETSELKHKLSQLQVERNHLDAIFHASPSAMLVVDAEGHVRRANRLARRWFGPEDLSGKLLIRDLFRIVSMEGEVPANEQHPFHRIRTTGEPLLDDRWKLEDESAQGRIVAVFGAPIFDEHGDFSGCVFNLHDLTEQTADRMRMHEFRQRLELAYLGSGSGMWDWYVDSGALVLCSRWSEILGYDSAQLEPRIETWTRLVHPDDLDPMLDQLQHHFQGEKPLFESEIRMLAANGQYRWVSVRGRLVARDKDGQPQRILGMMLDTDERRRRETEVQRQSELLTNVLSLVPYAIYWKDRDSKYLGCNQAFAKVVGAATPSEVVGKGDEQFNWTEAVSHRLRCEELQIMATGESRIGFDDKIQFADGAARSLLTSKVALRDPDGNIIGILGCFEDITERKRSEQVLREVSERATITANELERSQERLELALTATDDALFDWDVPSDTLYVSPRWFEMCGDDRLPPRTIRQWLDLVHSDDRERARLTLDDHLRGITPQFELEYRLQTSHGEYLWVLSRAKLSQRDSSGRPTRLVGTHTDVTRRKAVEAEIERLKGQLAAAIESIDAGLVMFDNNDHLVLANRQFREIYSEVAELIVPGIHYREILLAYGKRVPDALEGTPLHEWVEQRMTLLHQQLDEWLEELPSRWIRVSDRPTPEGGIVSLRTDITQLQLAQQELDHARQAAEVANHAKSEFLANMSHEIRTPMTAILGFADLLLEDDDPAALAEHVRTIRRNGCHLLAIINDILDLSKIEAGRVEFESIPYDMRALVGDVLELLQVRVQGRPVQLLAEFADQVPRVMFGDPTRVRQILTNLVGNAVKFTQSGSVKVVVSASADRRAVILSVVDTGIGIAPTALQNLFEPFQQADASATRKFGGTGLGLTISRRLARLMGGDIEVASEMGVGSCFEVSLPLVEPTPMDLVDLIDSENLSSLSLEPVPFDPAEFDQGIPVGNEQSVARARSEQVNKALVTREQLQGEQTLPCDLALERAPVASSTFSVENERTGLRVLVAEDGPDNRRLIGVLLKKFGCEFEMVEDGSQAVTRLMAEPKRYDLVLLDMQMPVMDGYTTAHRLRELGYELPIIALTAHTMSGDAEKCIAAGCTGFLGKPIDRERLKETLDQYGLVKSPRT